MFAINRRDSLLFFPPNFDKELLKEKFPKAKFILVGTTPKGYDLKTMKEDEDNGSPWVTKSEAISIAKSIDALEYIEIDIESMRNICYLFQRASYYSLLEN